MGTYQCTNCHPRRDRGDGAGAYIACEAAACGEQGEEEGLR